MNENTKSKLHENNEKYPNIKTLNTNDKNIDEIAFLVENHIKWHYI
jgi:hypothetical protein